MRDTNKSVTVSYVSRFLKFPAIRTTAQYGTFGWRGIKENKQCVNMYPNLVITDICTHINILQIICLTLSHILHI